jgi:hypothetical protein
LFFLIKSYSKDWALAFLRKYLENLQNLRAGIFIYGFAVQICGALKKRA